MRIEIDGVTYATADDAVPVLSTGAGRRLVISGPRADGREVLAAACLVVHCIKRDGTAKVQDPAKVAKVAEQIVAMGDLEEALADGRLPPTGIEPDRYLEAAVRTVALYGHEFPHLLRALAPRERVIAN